MSDVMKPYYETEAGIIYSGDSLDILNGLKPESVQCCITSPPYWGLRDYGVKGQLGLEKTPEEYVAKMVEIFSEVKRVLKDDGVLWLNLGDSYAGAGGMGSWVDSKASKGMTIIKQYPRNKPIKGLKPKDLCGIPWRVAFALQVDGWYLRSDIIWHKPNPMPESVTDRPTKAHEYIFLLTKSGKYFYDADAIKEKGAGNKWGKYTNPKYGAGSNGKMQSVKELTRDEYLNKYKTRNKRSVWTVATKPYKEAHFATYPEKLIEPCALAGAKKGDTIIDPFFGAGTTGVVACKYDRKFIGIELNPEYCEIAAKRIKSERKQRKLF